MEAFDPTAKLDWHKIGWFAVDILALVGGSFFLTKVGAKPERVQQAVERVTARPGYHAKPLRAVVAEVVADTIREQGPSPNFGVKPPAIDEDATAAARMLGVATDATADEIRAALRAKLSHSRLHPDHGGDGEAAKELIAAKNLLIQRLGEEKVR